jgi:hypothetical protein
MNRRAFLASALVAPAVVAAPPVAGRKRDPRDPLERLVVAEWRDRPWDALLRLERATYKADGEAAWQSLIVRACRFMERRAEVKGWQFETLVCYVHDHPEEAERYGRPKAPSWVSIAAGTLSVLKYGEMRGEQPPYDPPRWWTNWVWDVAPASWPPEPAR